jgi:hypothetical protein
VKKFFLLALIIFHSPARAQSPRTILNNVTDFLGIGPKARVSVDWQCPQGRASSGYLPQSQRVQVTFNNRGRVSLRPNIFQTRVPPGEADYAECRRNFLRAVEEAAARYRESNCQGNPDRPLCRNENASALVDARIARSDYFNPARHQHRHDDDCPDDHRQLPEPIRDIAEVIGDGLRAGNCQIPMPPGSWRMSQVGAQGSSQGMFHTPFLLERTPEGKYRASLNLQFRNVNGTTSAAQMRQRTQECLRNAGPALRGPDGEELEVNLLSEAELEALPRSKRPSGKTINVISDSTATAASTRGDATNFQDRFDCPAITHEILHHLGLCDEYHEMMEDRGCRPFTGAVNLMNDAWFAYRMAVPRTLECPCGEACQTAMRLGGNHREIYLGRQGHDLVPPTFQREYRDGRWTERCQMERTARVAPEGFPHPDRASIWKGESATSFTIENREVSSDGRILIYDYTCQCSSSDPICRTVKDHVRRVVEIGGRSPNCRQGRTDSNSVADEAWSRWGGPEAEPQQEGSTIRYTSTPVSRSLLSPNQFRRVIGGFCQGSAGIYHQCAPHTVRRTSQGCNTPDACYSAEEFVGGNAR